MTSETSRFFRCTVFAVGALFWMGLACTSSGGTGSKAPDGSTEEVLKFQVSEDNVRNYFFRQGSIGAHILTTSGQAPRVVWAFPTENTGIGIWFEQLTSAVQLVAESEVTPVKLSDGMWGVNVDLKGDVPSLSVKKAVLGNVRTVRDYYYSGNVPPEFDYNIEKSDGALVLNQNCKDGKHHVRLSIQGRNGTTAAVENNQIVFHAGSDAQIHVHAIALTDYDPLTGIPMNQLVTSEAAQNQSALQALAFLTYQEKLLAGSWRFLTYFGRDTMLSLDMLLPVLQPQVAEAGFGAVIDRLNSVDGGVAHEEALGDYGWYVREQMKVPQPPQPFSPWYDYKMVDSDFLLTSALAAYVSSPLAQGRIQSFLARKAPSGEIYADAVKRNIKLLIQRTTPFADNPVAANLIAIKNGEVVGNWRDSGTGLGGGKFPYDVNVALAPGALRGALKLYATGYLGSDPITVATLNRLAPIWETKPGDFFKIDVPMDTAKARVSSYAAGSGVQLDPAPAVASITGPITYRAVSLGADGNPVPVMHSDDGVVLFFTNPSDDVLQEIAGRILRPFPAGLRTDVGIVVANAALSDPNATLADDPNTKLQTKFTRGDYHGTVVWSWQQAMLAAGFERQLKRTNLETETVAQMRDAQTALWKVIQTASHRGSGELWSWQAKDGRTEFTSWAQAAKDVTTNFIDESNAIQLWSTVYLAVQPPK